MKFFKVVLATMLGVFLSFLVVSVIGFVFIIGIASSVGDKEEVHVKANSILHVKFDGEIVDRASKNPFGDFNFSSFEPNKKYGLNDILANIEKAKDDENIKGIYLDLSALPAGMATVEEIRNALLDFKESEKFIVSYCEVYSQKSYYLASVADEVWLNHAGLMEWRGLSAELMFFKGMLEKLEVEPQVIRHGKFKSAIEPFILDKMSEANREQTRKIIGSIWDHFTAQIAESRGLSVEKLNEIANSALIQDAEDAVEQKLVDALMYKDEVIAELKQRSGLESEEKLRLMSIGKYTDAKVKKESKMSNDKIAIIYATGGIESGNGDDETIGSERISKAIRKAREDDKVKAVVLRVNSPGGSALASDVIWREVVLTKESGKPIVASMGDVAASGGYYISCAASKILASPNTITGSIGVFGLLPNMQGLLNNKLGITIDTVKTNKFSDIGTPFRRLTEEERMIIQKGVDDIYLDFITKVAEGRGMQPDEIDSIGQGRVWSGIDALGLGLVDEIGGLEDAVAAAAELAELEEYRIVDYPEQEDPFKKLMKGLSGEGEAAIIKAQLGENYRYYKIMNEVMKAKGIQARMPFEMYIY